MGLSRVAQDGLFDNRANGLVFIGKRTGTLTYFHMIAKPHHVKESSEFLSVCIVWENDATIISVLGSGEVLVTNRVLKSLKQGVPGPTKDLILVGNFA